MISTLPQERQSMDSLKTPQEISNLLKIAMTEHQAGNLQSALSKYQEILIIFPRHPDALHLSGLVYYQSGDNKKAIRAIKKAISIAPKQFSFYGNLGLAYAAEGDFENAIKNYKKAVDIKPDYPEALYNLGNSFQKIDQVQKAIKYYRKVIKIKPNYIKAYNNLGTLLKENNRKEDAKEIFENALLINDKDYSIYNNLGVIASDLDMPENAISYFNKALSLIEESQKLSNMPILSSKEHAEIYHNIGLAYIDIGDFNNAHIYIDKTLNLDGELIDAKFSKFIAYLSSGNFLFGWKEYTSRPKKDGITTKYDHILHDLKECRFDKTQANIPLVVLPEQGIGDEVMFASIIPDLTNKHNNRVIVACDERLVDIYQRSFKNVDITSLKNLNVSPEMQKIHIGNLAQYFRNTESEFKPEQTYISPKEETAQYYHNKYSNITGLKVGIAWKSGNTDQGKRRSLQLDKWKEILAVPNCSFLNLQYGEVKNEIDDLKSSTGINIIDDNEIDQLKDLENFIALISTLDLVITIDNTTVHIAGALGVPTWLMLPFACDWRWMRGRNDSIWYKSLKLYRQNKLGDWSNVIESISNDLQTYKNI